MTKTVTEDVLSNLKVLKRNGRKLVDFDKAKIAIAIKKGFDSISIDDEVKYTDKDIQKVYKGVIKKIEKIAQDVDKLKIEEIQDLIEDELKKDGYEDVYTSFSEYRERRNNFVAPTNNMLGFC